MGQIIRCPSGDFETNMKATVMLGQQLPVARTGDAGRTTNATDVTVTSKTAAEAAGIAVAASSPIKKEKKPGWLTFDFHQEPSLCVHPLQFEVHVFIQM